MDEAIKDRVILILGLFISNISSCSNAYRQKSARDKEMATRLDLEEKMSKYSQESVKLQEKANASIKELEEEKVALEASKKALAQEQLVNQSLKEELQKVTKLKEALEDDLKDALVSAKSRAKK
jgi:seryl-tRNA synthetase